MPVSTQSNEGRCRSGIRNTIGCPSPREREVVVILRRLRRRGRPGLVGDEPVRQVEEQGTGRRWRSIGGSRLDTPADGRRPRSELEQDLHPIGSVLRGDLFRDLARIERGEPFPPRCRRGDPGRGECRRDSGGIHPDTIESDGPVESRAVTGSGSGLKWRASYSVSKLRRHGLGGYPC